MEIIICACNCAAQTEQGSAFGYTALAVFSTVAAYIIYFLIKPDNGPFNYR